MKVSVARNQGRAFFASNVTCGLMLFSGLTPLSAFAQETSAAAGDQLVEIVVTAQRREQNLQDIPIAVSAFNGETLEAAGVSNVKELVQVEPSLNVPQVVGVYLPFLRGVGNSAGGGLGNESSVPVYLDDIYYTRLSTAYLAINSIDRVEVLKGPQGTLFGRNSSGGAIQMFSKDPGGEPEFNATVGYGNYDTISGRFYVSTPITDTLSWNLAFGGADQREGWGKSLTTGDDAYLEKHATVRSKLVWEPSDETRVKLVGFYAYTKGDIGIANDRHSGTYGGTPALTLPGYPVPPVVLPSLADVPGDHFYDTRLNFRSVALDEGYGASVRVDQDIGFADFVSITGYRESEGLIRTDADLSGLDFQNADLNHTDEQLSQEFQIKSKNDSPIDWIVGAYYLNSEVAYVPAVVYGDLLTVAVAPGATQNIYSEQTIDSYSVYGQATAPITSKTNLTLGVRFTSDEVSAKGWQTATIPGLGEIPLGGVVRFSKTFEEVTWRGAIDHRFTDDLMAYASVSRGYKAGTFNILPLDSPAADPETVDAYEIGVKSELFDNRVRLNGAVFLNEVSNPQVLTVIPKGLTSGIGLTNAEESRIKGAELGFEAIAADGLKLRGAVTYLDGEFVSFPNAPFYSQNAVTIVGPVLGDASGNSLPAVSKWRYNVGANYTVNTSLGEWVGDVGVAYTGKFAWNPDNLVWEDAVTLVNASLSFTPSAMENVTLGVWGKNLSGEEYVSVSQESVGPFGAGGFQTSAAPPRTYGVELSVRY